MSSDDFHNYMGHLWIQKEDNVITIGLNEEALEEFEEITSIDLPRENEKVGAEEICGTVETNEGPLDIYSPAEGKVLEINQAAVDDPSVIMEDPYGDGWLIRVESNEDIDMDEDDEDEDEDDDYDDEEDEE